MTQEVFDILPWVAGGISAVFNALFGFALWMTRGRIADLKAEAKQADERAERLRQALDECHQGHRHPE